METISIAQQSLWVEDGGRICCEAHAGGYLRAAIAANPNARRHHTPFGVVELISVTDPAWGGCFVPECETCAAKRAIPSPDTAAGARYFMGRDV